MRSRRLRICSTAVCVVALLLPAAAAADPQSDLEEVEEDLDEAREGLEVLEGQRQVTVSDLAAVDARRQELDAQLTALTDELGVAQSALNAAEASLTSTTQELEATQGRLATTRAELAEGQRRFGDRARDAYIHRRSGYAAALLDVRDVSVFGRSIGYLQAVTASERAQVERIIALEREVQQSTVLLGNLQDEQAALRATAATERDRVAGLVTEQEEVTAAAEAEAQRHRVYLVEIESDKDSYEALVAALEQSSEQLEAELAGIAEAQRAKAAAVAAAPAPDTPAVAASNATQPASNGQLGRPCDGRVTSGFGYRTHPITGTRRLHAGTDFGAPTGTPIYAAADGTVVSAGWRGGYGKAVVIDHGGGMATLSAHQSRLAVGSGARVSRGQLIGYVGSTGFSTGPHLHFEVRINGRPVDPMSYL